MSAKQPPVPPANRAPHGGTPEQHVSDVDTRKASNTVDPDKIGQQGNSKINTTHQGYQQDR